MLKLNIVIILLYALERFAELFVSYRNKKILEKDNPIELLDEKEGVQMRFFHISWFLVLLIESTLVGRMLPGIFFYACTFVLVLSQVLRWSAVFTLGKYWSVDIYRMDNHPVIQEGPYTYVRHPNYLAVIAEFFFLPLLLGSPITLIIGSVMNLFMLKRRIKMEEKALNTQAGEYERKFKGKNRFFPLLNG